MPRKAYATAQALRTAVETRFMAISQRESADIMRLRRQFAFDRLLSRIFQDKAGSIFLKGGYALELRIQNARATVDIDLSVKKGRGGRSSPAAIRDFLQEKASLDLGDHLIYTVGTQRMELTHAPYGGYRFPVMVTMAGRPFFYF